MDFKDLKSFDWRSLKRYTSPQSTADLNKFLEKLPQNTNQTLLVIMGVAWACAATLGLYTHLQMTAFTEMRAELQEMRAVKPAVPVLTNKAVKETDVKSFVKQAEEIYGNVSFSAKRSAVVLGSNNTTYFGQFREAIGHVQNGGAGWKIEIESLCVGRECNGNQLSATLKVNKISVEKPG